MRLRKSASGICSRPSAITLNSLTRSLAMSLLATTSSFGPALRRRTRVSVFSTMRPLTLRSSLVVISTIS